MRLGLSPITQWGPVPEGYQMNNESIREEQDTQFNRRYVGEFNAQGKWSGRGFIIYPNGFVQSGYWKNNERDPRRFHGRTLYPDMSVFQGFYI